MSWVYNFDPRALKELRKLGKQARCDIIAYLDQQGCGAGDPRHRKKCKNPG